MEYLALVLFLHYSIAFLEDINAEAAQEEETGISHVLGRLQSNANDLVCRSVFKLW